MNDFLFSIQKHMIDFKKKNLNIINEFKIQMFQARKRIEKDMIKQQFDLKDSNFISLQNNLSQITNFNEVSNNIDLTNKQNSKNCSTNYNSRGYDSNRLASNNNYSSININPFGSKLFNNQFYTDKNNNKQNQDPNVSFNRQINTDISVIEEFPLKNNTTNKLVTQSDEPFQKQMNALKNDQSIEITTEEVRKKYEKFKSASEGGLMKSGQSANGRFVNHDFVPHCAEFQFDGEQEKFNTSEQNQEFHKDLDYFGFKTITNENLKKTHTIKELEQFEQNQSQYF